MYVCVLVAQSCPALCNPMDYSPPGSSVHGTLQAQILEWVTIPFSRDLLNQGTEPRFLTLQADALLFESLGKPTAAQPTKPQIRPISESRSGGGT